MGTLYKKASLLNRTKLKYPTYIYQSTIKNNTNKQLNAIQHIKIRQIWHFQMLAAFVFFDSQNEKKAILKIRASHYLD
ncbi:hypothetical protein DS957_006230 [Vibrio harveyi]|uniref:Uncharacterized protein n=1 Tax=Vibrio harveyi TaxID=669 RepID=A0A8B3DJ07_VIBHA|nr:hypothetical protein DS957_006230 [Vibrio harveyi]